MKRKNKKNNKQGFSFIEVLVSVLLVSVGLMAAVSLISSNLKRTINNRNQSIAGLLAQEGNELVINVRDSNIRNGNESFDPIRFPVVNSYNCVIDPNVVSAGVNLGSLCAQSIEEETLYYYSDPKGYYHDFYSGEKKKTQFKRKINLVFIGTTSMRVTSMVIWDKTLFPVVSDCNSATKCAYAQTTLTNWKE